MPTIDPSIVPKTALRRAATSVMRLGLENSSNCHPARSLHEGGVLRPLHERVFVAKLRFAGRLLLVSLFTGCTGSEPAGPFDAERCAAGDVRQAADYTSLYSFAGAPDGERPLAGLIVDGEFYGTTSFGGFENKCPNGCGTVFKLSAQGRERVVHLFKGPRRSEPARGADRAEWRTLRSDVLRRKGRVFGRLRCGVYDRARARAAHLFV